MRSVSPGRRASLDVCTDQFGHFKHGHLALTTKDRLQLLVSVDVGLLGLILQAMFFDIVPQFLGELPTGGWFRSHHRREDFIGLDGFCESRVEFARGFGRG